MVALLKEQKIDITELNADVIVNADDLQSLGTDHISVISVLFQSGYLTINGYDRDSMTLPFRFSE